MNVRHIDGRIDNVNLGNSKAVKQRLVLWCGGGIYQGVKRNTCSSQILLGLLVNNKWCWH